MIFVLATSVLINGSLGVLGNYTAIEDAVSRQKRFLTFPPTTAGSVLKYVAGYLGPIVSMPKQLEKHS